MSLYFLSGHCTNALDILVGKSNPALVANRTRQKYFELRQGIAGLCRWRHAG